MDARNGSHADARSADAEVPTAEAVDFVRFCYHRRRVAWPELYDEMCLVASRGVFRGWGFAELAEHGVRFTLSDLPGLAAVASDVSRTERARARSLREAARTQNADTGDAETSGGELTTLGPVPRSKPVPAAAD